MRNSTRQQRYPATSETSSEPTGHPPNGSPTTFDTHEYTGRNAQEFCVTCPSVPSGSTLG